MIRLYGVSVGQGSFARVTEGVRFGLRELGRLAGFVPIESLGDDDAPAAPGADAPVAVYIGPPAGVALVPTWHTKRWALLMPNSSWVPEAIVQGMWPHVTGFFCASAWAAGVLRPYVERVAVERAEVARPVSVYQHGVLPAFSAGSWSWTQEERLREYAAGEFRALHLASTHMERKGTGPLLEAWCELVARERLGPKPRLTLIVDGPRDRLEKIAARKQAVAASIAWIDRLGADAAYASSLYQHHHLVCQPSRGEGFGLVPLEARASGVAVVMTACTGHGEHYPSDPTCTPGVVRVRHGDDAPIDDGPGAMAPSVRADDVAASLTRAYDEWPQLADSAQAAAADVAKNWSWPAVTARWLDKEEESR